MTSILRQIAIAATLLAATAGAALAQNRGAVYWNPITSPNLQPMASGNLRYRWQRDGIVVDLKDRNGSWMAPLDGGWNAVRFRGAGASHVPVSHETVYAWVPSIRASYAPVTVTTQDGASGGAGFSVDRPWWMFW